MSIYTALQLSYDYKNRVILFFVIVHTVVFHSVILGIFVQNTHENTSRDIPV